MSFILNIDSSTEIAAVSLAENGEASFTIINQNQKDHAAFLHNAINDVMQKSSLQLRSLSAIAVTNGPGSYTGLRVGMASAKGLCYALNKPLITVGTLPAMAKTIIDNQQEYTSTHFFCPLIDARRMEVYTALYDKDLNEIFPPMALILDENSFGETLKTNNICFFGSGARKFESVLSHKKAAFLPVPEIINSIDRLSFKKFSTGDFTDLIDSEPLYIKNFHSSPDLSNKK